LSQIMALAEERPLVNLPSHDPESLFRLQQQSVVKREAVNTGNISRIPLLGSQTVPGSFRWASRPI
jgi:hypothetical protein